MEQILSFTTPRAQMTAFNNVPENLYAAYHKVIERIEKAGGNDADLAMRIISWIHHARRILKMDELLEALVVDEYCQDGSEGQLDGDVILEETLKPHQVIKTCKGLVLYEESSGLVRFSHETVKGFIESEMGQKLQFPSPIMLAKTCVIYLGLSGLGPCHDSASLKQRLGKYKFSRYAALFWAHHTRGEAENDPDNKRAVLSLLASENKKDSMLQLETYANSSWGQMSFTKGQTLLHVIAKNGLATICKWVLDGRINGNDTYVFRVDI